MSQDVTDEQRAHYRRSVERAKAVLQQGDRVRVRTCGDGHATYTFEAWDGGNGFFVSKSGIDELHPNNLTRLNGQPISFRDVVHVGA